MQQARRRCTLALLSAAVTGATAAPESARAAGLDLYLLVGQSNMAGRGKPLAEDRIADPRVLTLDATDQWRPATEPLHFDKPDIVGVGPGRAFALAMIQAQPRGRIGLVPCAVGGTRLALWQPAERFADTGSQPWDDTVRRIAAAAPAGRWRGVLFHQGESDCNAADAPLYLARLQAFVGRLRIALDDSDLPIVLGQIGRWPERPWTPWTEAVDAAQQQLARSLPRMAFVASEGLNHGGDALHFDAASARTLGRRYALAMQALQAGTATHDTAQPSPAPSFMTPVRR